MIHCRNAYDDVLDILKEYKKEAGKKLRGNCHFFAGTIDHAKEFLDMDFTISFTGVITFAKEYEELVKYVPLELMHAETDSPYVAPVPFRGGRNEPAFVEKVVNRIADIKEVSFEEVERQLIKNAKELYKLQ
jgi:TatD DNase family protein